jgi:hypothetical protein
MLLFVAVVNTAFALLVDRFGYDDILREPAAAILARFAAGGVLRMRGALRWLGCAW